MKNGMLARILMTALGAYVFVFNYVQAEETGSDNDWEFSAVLYLWGADIGGKTASGNEIDVSFNDLFDNLNTAFMGGFEARKNKWLAMADFLYLDVSADGSTKVSIPVGPIEIDFKGEAEIDMKGTVFQLAGGYNLHSDWRSRIDLIGGARYLDTDMDTKIVITGPITSRPIDIPQSVTVWDGIVGVKGRYALGQRWAIPYYVDAGTGQSDFTWQVMAGVTYNAAKWLDIALAYRYLNWEIGDDTLKRINFSGPGLGAVFRF